MLHALYTCYMHFIDGRAIKHSLIRKYLQKATLNINMWFDFTATALVYYSPKNSYQYQISRNQQKHVMLSLQTILRG